MGGADSDYSACRWCDELNGHTWDCPKTKERNMPKGLDQVDVQTLRDNAVQAYDTRKNPLPDECPVCGAFAIREESSVQNVGASRAAPSTLHWRHSVLYACNERGTATNALPQSIEWSRSCRSAWDAALEARRRK